MLDNQLHRNLGSYYARQKAGLQQNFLNERHLSIHKHVHVVPVRFKNEGTFFTIKAV